jgi:hypothetical protein
MSEQSPFDARTNAEWQAQWTIDVDQDPYALPLETLRCCRTSSGCARRTRSTTPRRASSARTGR